MVPTADGQSNESKENDNNETNNNICGHCKRTVKDKVVCKKCNQVFHPACTIAAIKSQNKVCNHESEERQDSVDRLVSEIKLLKRIIQEQDEKYRNLEKVNKLLQEDNNKLLIENSNYLQEKLKQIKNPIVPL